MPRFSIITSCLNPGPVIEAAVTSVLDQSFDDLELLLIDGGSVDGTIERVAALLRGRYRASEASESTSAHSGDARWTAYALPRSRIRVRLHSGPDAGLYDALNKGVRFATGDVVGLVHADDRLAHEHVLEHIVPHFEAGADVVYGDLQYVRESPKGEIKVVRHWRSGAFRTGQLAWGWMPPHLALYVRRAAYEWAALADGVYFDPSFRCAGDYDFILRLFARLRTPPVYVPEVLVRMLAGGMSNRNLRSLVMKSREDWKAIRRNRVGSAHTLIAKNLRKVGQFRVFG